MADQVQMTKEEQEKAKEIRGEWIARWVAKYGQAQVESWLDDPDKLGLINALVYLEATGQ